MPFPAKILSRLLAELPSPAPRLQSLHLFSRWVIAEGVRYAMAGNLAPLQADAFNVTVRSQIGRPTDQIICQWGTTGNPLGLALAAACLNASLPEPPGLFEGNSLSRFEAIAKSSPTCFIGHFPIAGTWRDNGYPVSIIELQPGPGDIPWNDSVPALREAELVFITGQTLLNGTFLEVLDRTPKARHRVLVGPSVPCSPVFFDYGINWVGSSIIVDSKSVLSHCRLPACGLHQLPPTALRRVNLSRSGLSTGF